MPADQTGIGALRIYVREASGFDVVSIAKDLLSGCWTFDADVIESALARLGAQLKDGLLGTLASLAAPVLVSLALRAITGDGQGGAIVLICRMGCAAMLMERFAEARAVASAALRVTSGLIDLAAPVLASALTLTAHARAAAVLTPSAALCAKLVTDALSAVGLLMCSAAAAVAMAANLSDRFPLNRLFRLLSRTTAWSVGLLLSMFTGLMSVQGLLAGPQDAAASQALRQAIRSALPIVGGDLSNASDALLGSAAAVRGVAGVSGVLAVVLCAAAPVGRLMLSAFSLKIAASVLEPLAEPGLVRITAHFGAVTELLAAICAGGAMLAVICLGACVSLSG